MYILAFRADEQLLSGSKNCEPPMENEIRNVGNDNIVPSAIERSTNVDQILSGLENCEPPMENEIHNKGNDEMVSAAIERSTNVLQILSGSENREAF